MHKRIISVLLAVVVALLSSCSLTSTSVEKTVPKKNSNKSNSITINKKKIDDDIVLSPYYTPVTLDTGYNCLDTYDERRMYNEIIGSADNFDNGSMDEDGNYTITTINLKDCKLSARDISKVFFAIELDRPDFFWLANPYSYSVSGDNFSLTLSSSLSYKDYLKCKGQLNSVINSVLAGLKPNMSEIKRELYIHDYLVKNCVYQENSSNNDNRYTIYGCLVEQSAVCEGYKNAFQLLLSYCGIKSYGVSGSTDDSKNVDHVWNAVLIDGDYYYTDVTWDDAEDMVMYDYFNITTKELLHSHSIAKKFDDVSGASDFKSTEVLNYNLAIPKCTAKKYNYYRYYGSNLSSMDSNSLVSDLVKAAEKKNEYFYITVDKKLNYTNIYDQMFSDDIFLFAGYIDQANAKLGYNAIQTSVSVLKRKWLRTIIVGLKYN